MNQKKYSVAEMAKMLNLTPKTISLKATASLKVDGIVVFNRRSFFVIKVSRSPVFYECLIDTMRALGNGYLCLDCREIINKVTINAT